MFIFLQSQAFLLQVDPYFAEGFNHQNLEMAPEYLPRLHRFITDLKL